MLAVGALAVIRYAQRHGTRRTWLVQLLARRATKVAAVALANKMAWMVWAVIAKSERYRELDWERLEMARSGSTPNFCKGAISGPSFGSSNLTL